MYTRQPVEASTRFSELPLGPRRRPTKLNWHHVRVVSVDTKYNQEATLKDGNEKDRIPARLIQTWTQATNLCMDQAQNAF